VLLNYLHCRQNLQNLTQLVRFLKLNYLIEGNNQCLLYEYSETCNHSLLQNVEFFLMLQRLVHIRTTGFLAVNMYIDFSELHCLVHLMFYAYVSFFPEMLETVLLAETQIHSNIKLS